MRSALALSMGVALASLSGVACRDAGAQNVAPLRDGADGGAAQPPSSLLSRGRPVAGWTSRLRSQPKNVNDGDPWSSWNAGKPTPAEPAWVAIDVGAGPSRVLLNWSAAGSFNYEETEYGSPGAYRVETSSDSTDGKNGNWKIVARVDSVTTHGQAHSFDFSGQRWVRMVVTGAPAKSPNGVQIDEVEVHEAPSGNTDAWFFMGDSITAFAFGRPPKGEPGFAARVQKRHPRRFPAVINGGIGGEKSDEGVKHVDEWLAKNPDARYWGIAYGTNDAAGDTSDTSRFRANMQTIIDRVRASGRTPVLATVPFASDGQHSYVTRFNEVIEDLRRANGLPKGPDLYAWFLAHPGELKDGIHPDERGIGSINRLWAEAASAVYGP